MNFQEQRHNMVEGQVRPNKVTDEAIFDALEAIPRELFVPKSMQGLAYSDAPLKVAKDRYLMPPMVIARMLESAIVEPSDVALMIGVGSGYEAALLGKLAESVVVVEQDAEMVAQSSERLASIDMDAIAVVEGNMAEGLPKEGPFDVILFNGAIAEMPPAILDQLSDGGRAVAVIHHVGVGRATVYTKVAGTVTAVEAFDANTPFLAGFEPKASFVF